MGNLTSKQQSAVDNIKAWFHETNPRLNPCYTLLGAAGTGKSFTISYLLKQLPGQKLALSPTNKAAQVLEEFFFQAGIQDVKVTTIHSALGYRVQEGKGKYRVKGKRIVNDATSSLEAMGEHKIGEDTALIIVDEASMVDINLEEELTKIAQSFGARILWVGDGYQLKPPGKIQCKAIKGVNKSELTEVVRYSGGSLMIATRIRQSIDTKAAKIPLRQMVAFQNELPEELHNVELLPKQDWHSKLREDVVKNKDFKAIAFKNDTVIGLNSLIRDYRGRIRDLELDDTLIAMKPVQIDTFKVNKHIHKSNNRFYNGELVEIVDNVPTTLTIEDFFTDFDLEKIEDLTIEPEQFIAKLWGKTNSNLVKRPGREITVSSVDNPTLRSNVKINFLDPENLDNIKEYLMEVNDVIDKYKLFTSTMYGLMSYADALHSGKDFKASKVLEKQFNPVVKEAIIDLYEYLVKQHGKFTSKVVQGAKTKINKAYQIQKQWESLQFLTYHWNYADAITVHKSQGSTFTDVFLDGGDIMKAPGYKNLLYVALTRASGKVYIKE